MGGIGDEKIIQKIDLNVTLLFMNHLTKIIVLHLDGNGKILSGYYLSNKGTGTSLYYSHGERHSQVEWRPNGEYYLQETRWNKCTYRVENDIPHQEHLS